MICIGKDTSRGSSEHDKEEVQGTARLRTEFLK